MKRETKIEYGYAARRNRGRNSGTKVHKLYAEYIVGLDEGEVATPGTMLEIFQRTGRPVLYSCYPACGCTQGQHAGKPNANLTAEQVTCTKCAERMKEKPGK